MQKIYEGAHRVIVWLGDAEQGGTKCMDVIRNLSRATMKAPDVVLILLGDVVDIIYDYIHSVFGHRRMEPLEHFFSTSTAGHPWFLRRWLSKKLEHHKEPRFTVVRCYRSAGPASYASSSCSIDTQERLMEWSSQQRWQSMSSRTSITMMAENIIHLFLIFS
jgi:hypothetical protein